MYERAVYKEPHRTNGWSDIPDPVGTVKHDGASYFVRVEGDGSLRYFSRRQSVRGHFPERTEALPHLTAKKLPQYAGNVYNVELVHTGLKPSGKESHPAVSGILNSLPPKAIETQSRTGPVRAILHNVIEPSLPTYKDKLLHLKEVQDAYGDPDVLSVTRPYLGAAHISKLINSTKTSGDEGVIVTSLSRHESNNPRIKVKHYDTYNLRVVGVAQEVDKHGQLKPSMGSLIVADRNGHVVANVGTGFTHEMRKDAWENKHKWVDKIIQVKTMGLSRQRLRAPVYNGDSDGQLDSVI